jgi:hypothetical protein
MMIARIYGLMSLISKSVRSAGKEDRTLFLFLPLNVEYKEITATNPTQPVYFEH